MKTYSILISIDNKAKDVINYYSEERSSEKEYNLVIKFINCMVCNIKSIKEINNYKIIITSEKNTIYNVTWKGVSLWNESELED